MKRLLSIDFDYFLDTDIKTRDNKFPIGNDNPLEKNKKEWDKSYEEYPELYNIGLLENEFTYIKNLVKNLKYKKYLISDSHEDISKFFDELKESKEVEVINIDFHHDFFITGGDKLDCGNWVRFLMDINPNINFTWIRREDSDVNTFFGEFPYKHLTDIKEVKGNFDYIFICFSSAWSPPHLIDRYKELTDIII